MRIALLTGLRLNSIRTLTWECVDFHSNIVTIESSFSKNKKIHVLSMSSSLRILLLEAKLSCGDSKYVLPNAMALAKTTISDKFRLLCKRLGVQGLRFHDLRHTCGTRLAEKGYGIETISKVLGHSSIVMSMRYVHPKESVKRAMEDLATFESRATQTTTHEL
jgi:integrase